MKNKKLKRRKTDRVEVKEIGGGGGAGETQGRRQSEAASK